MPPDAPAPMISTSAHSGVGVPPGVIDTMNSMTCVALFGTPVVRREDARFLTGDAQYVSNLDIPGAAAVAYVTSTVAHARIAGIDGSEAWKQPRVIHIVTAADLDIGPAAPTDKAWPAAKAPPPPATDTGRLAGPAPVG